MQGEDNRIWKMADESIRSKLISCSVVTFLVLYFAAFVTFTIVQVRKTQDLESRLEERRNAVKNLSQKCLGNSEEVIKITGLVRSIRSLAQRDERFDAILKMVSTRQTSSFSSLMQDLLHAQEQLLLQQCSPDTVICLAGSKGEQGLTGVTGSAGIKGRPGLLGQKGEAGLPGIIGEKGARGPRGEKGLTGDLGPAGRQGQRGERGDNNTNGIKGLKGETGIPGAEGDPGKTGEVGDVGLRGEPGNDGEKGEVGPIGPTGTKGKKGDPGSNGSTPISSQNCDCVRPLTFRNNDTKIDAPLGSRVTLNCSTDAQPTPTVTWVKNDQYGCFKNQTTSVGSTLTIDALQPVDLGTYTCIISNKYGSITKDITVQTPDPTDIMSCDFESGFCNWRQGTDDDINWVMGTGGTFTSGTGPAGDHTTLSLNGHFPYLLASNSSVNEKARLEHLMIPVQSERCLTFWYNMHGAHVGSLSVLTKDCDGIESQIWTKGGEQGTGWNSARINVPANTHGQTLILEASRGNGIFGDIAVDDVTISDKPCRPEPQAPKFLENNSLMQVNKQDNATLDCSVSGYPNPTVTWSKTGTCFPQNISAIQGQLLNIVNAKLSDSGIYKCMGKNSVGTAEKYIQITVNDSKSCAFDSVGLDATCGWTQVQNGKDDFDWDMRPGHTPSSETGPINDHTKGDGSGQYMYIEASNRQTNSSARLQSVLLPAGFNFCLNLWYNMYGTDTGTLKVIRQFCNSKAEQTLWELSGNQGKDWFRKCIEVKQQSNDFYLVIEGVRGQGIHSDIAIDDVILKMAAQCNCPQKAIRLSCNFDSDTCGWTQGQNDDFDWKRHSGETLTIDTGPSSDHTSGSGYYMYIEASDQQQGQTAQLRSRDLPGGLEYCMEFSYNMYGRNMGQLDIYSEVPGQTKVKLFHKQGDQTMAWHTEKISIPRQSGTFKILIEGTRGSNYLSDLAIDDVNITSGHC